MTFSLNYNVKHVWPAWGQGSSTITTDVCDSLLVIPGNCVLWSVGKCCWYVQLHLCLQKVTISLHNTKLSLSPPCSQKSSKINKKSACHLQKNVSMDRTIMHTFFMCASYKMSSRHCPLRRLSCVLQIGSYLWDQQGPGHLQIIWLSVWTCLSVIK